MKFTEARSQLSQLYSRISEGGVEVIANASEYRQLLERQNPFRIEIRFGERSVAAWIKGLPVHAEGETVEEVLDGLAAALVDYASTWEKHLQHAPNHKENIGYVRRVQLAGSTSAVRQMLARDATRGAGGVQR